MSDKKTQTQRYEELIKAMQEGEMGMAKFLWNLLEKMEGSASGSETKIKDFQDRIEKFIAAFKDRKDGKPGKDGKTATKEELIAIMKPLLKPGKDGRTPSKKELLDLIASVMPDPIPGEQGKPGKPGKDGKRGRIPDHEWNGTLVRFQKPDGSWGEFVNLQGPAGQNADGPGFSGGKTGAIERVRGQGFEAQGISQIYFGENLTITRIGDNGVRIDAEDGGSGGGTNLSFETPTGTIDDSNVTFDVLNVPLYLVVNGVQYFENVHYTLAGLTITLNNPVGTGGFIRSAYGSGLTIEIPTGTVDDSNTTFTVAHEPKYVVINGAQYFNGAGYTYTSGQIDLDFPVGDNGFIRSVY